MRDDVVNYWEEKANRLTPKDYAGMLDSCFRDLLGTYFSSFGAEEGTLWLVDQEQAALIPVINTGPQAETFELNLVQPLSEGVVSMVYLMRQSHCENDMQGNKRYCPQADELLYQQTHSMIAVPVHFANETRGVLSCVHLRDKVSFSGKDLSVMESLVCNVGRLMDGILVRSEA